MSISKYSRTGPTGLKWDPPELVCTCTWTTLKSAINSLIIHQQDKQLKFFQHVYCRGLHDYMDCSLKIIKKHCSDADVRFNKELAEKSFGPVAELLKCPLDEEYGMYNENTLELMHLLLFKGLCPSDIIPQHYASTIELNFCGSEMSHTHTSGHILCHQAQCCRHTHTGLNLLF